MSIGTLWVSGGEGAGKDHEPGRVADKVSGCVIHSSGTKPKGRIRNEREVRLGYRSRLLSRMGSGAVSRRPAVALLTPNHFAALNCLFKFWFTIHMTNRVSVAGGGVIFS